MTKWSRSGKRENVDGSEMQDMSSACAERGSQLASSFDDEEITSLTEATGGAQ